jgi:DNA-binding MarR family transcriptional regulator
MKESGTVGALAGGADAALVRRVEAVRTFNRFYVQRIGVLDDAFLDSPYSAAEARVLYELSWREAPTASEIARELSLDPGYLSRILHGFIDDGLIERHRSRSDARQWLLALTPRGREVFTAIEEKMRERIAAMLSSLSPDQQERMIAALEDVMEILKRPRQEGRPVVGSGR